MNVLLVGSLNFEGAENPVVRQRFTDACRQIGIALARSGHTIIVRSNHPCTADRFVVEGANSVKGRHRIICYEPDKGGEWEGEFRQIEFTRKQSSGPWPTDQVNQIMAADVVILIGGRRGTIQTAYVAPILGRPVLAIPSFGGTSSEAWRNFRADYRKILDCADQLENLASDWKDNSAELVLQAAHQLVKRNPYRESYKREISIGIGILVSLVTWTAVFLSPFPPYIASFVVLALISSVLGSCLRALLKSIAHPANVIAPRELALEMLGSLVLAFGLALLYLTGGLTITGDPKLLRMIDIDQFQRVGIVASLLGFGAGLLLEKAAQALQKRIGRIFR